MIIGTAGHIDHGKTALVRALTGVDADRLPEEKARGITIDLGFAYRPVADGETLGFVDVPGHEGFIHNMLAGAAGIDFVLLVVAADDGTMPQTREHLQIVDLLGVEQGLVAITKCDLMPADHIAEVEAEVRELIAGSSLAGAEILQVSALRGDGIPTLEARLLAAAQGFAARRAAGRFRLAIDRSFSLTGAGTIVTGTVFAGEARVGDHLVVSPSGLPARVRGIHAQNAAAAIGRAGQRCALNLAGADIEKDRLHRGDWVVDEALHVPTDRIDSLIRLLPSETRPLRHWTPVHLHLGAAHVSARIALLDRDTLPPGGEALAQLVLDRPAGALNGDRFVFRDQSAQRTMGGGTVVDPWPPARGRRRPERLAQLVAMAEAVPAAALASLAAGEPGFVDLGRFALARNLAPEPAAALWRSSGLVVAEEGGVAFGFGKPAWEAFAKAVVEVLAQHHKKSPESPGLEAQRLRLALPMRLPLPVFSAAVAALVRERRVVLEGAWLKLQGHSVQLTAAEERIWARIEPLMAKARFQPPRVRDFADTLGAREDELRKLLRRLARMGRLVEVAPDHFFERATVGELVKIAQALERKSPDHKITAAAFRDDIGTGRKVAIQILEFFDRVGVTRRDGDLREIRLDKAQLFESPRK